MAAGARNPTGNPRPDFAPAQVIDSGRPTIPYRMTTFVRSSSMRISTAVAILAAGLVAVQPAHAQARGKGRAAAAPAPAAPAMAMATPLAGRWEGTFTNDITQKGG